MRNFAVIALALAYISISTSARANAVCDELAAADVRAEMRMVEITRDYPGTVMALAACVATAASQPASEQANTFAGCGVIACALVGVDNCFVIGKEVLALTVQQNRVKEQKAHYNCQ